MKTAFSLKTLILVCLINTAALADMNNPGYRLKAAGQVFLLEIADSKEQKARGLMHRQSMPASHGLLMVFKQDVAVPIWMKNVLFPLDVIWISHDGIVVDLKTLPQCSEDPCPVFRPRQTARFVLEVGAGLFPLNRGDKVEIIDASGDSLHPPVSGL